MSDNIVVLPTDWNQSNCGSSIRYRIEHRDDANIQSIEDWIERYQIVCSVRPIVTETDMFWDFEIGLQNMIRKGLAPLRLWPIDS